MAYQASRMSIRDYQIEIYLQVWPGATPLLPLARTCWKARMRPRRGTLTPRLREVNGLGMVCGGTLNP